MTVFFLVNRQKTLLDKRPSPDKRPSWTKGPLTKHPLTKGPLMNYFFGTEEGLLSELTDKRPSLVLKTKGPPVSNRKREGLLSRLHKRAFCPS